MSDFGDSMRTSPALRWALAAVLLAGVTGTMGMAALERGGVRAASAPWMATTVLALACAVIAMLKASSDLGSRDLGSTGMRHHSTPPPVLGDATVEEGGEPASARDPLRTTAFTALAVGLVVFCASAYFLKCFVGPGVG